MIFYTTSYHIFNIPFELARHRHFLSTPIEYCDGVESCLSFGRQRQHDQAIGGKTSSLHSSVLFQTPQTKRKDFNGNNSKQSQTYLMKSFYSQGICNACPGSLFGLVFESKSTFQINRSECASFVLSILIRNPNKHFAVTRPKLADGPQGL